VTNPQGPPNDPTAWGRPGNQGPFGNPAAPTERFRTGQPQGGFGQQDQTVPGQLPGPTEQFSAAAANPQRPGHPPPQGIAGPPRAQPPAPKEEATKPKKKGRLRSPLSIFLVLIIVVALVLAALIGAELYARNEATNKIATAAACEAKDTATAKFGVAPLVLYQLATKHFTNISVETGGHQFRDAKGMTLQVDIKDIRLNNTADSKGTIGSINATVTWTADGIKDTLTSKVLGGDILVSSLTTKPNDKTIEMKGVLENIAVQPTVSDGKLKLQIVSYNVLGSSKLGRNSAQSKMDNYTSDLMNKLPLGIHVDSVDVTSTGIVLHLSSQNATIPANTNKTPDPCFANL
jgi:hypothetical protein